MNILKKSALILLWSITIVFFLRSPLQAYVLQGRHVLDLMIEKLGPAKSLFVSEKLTVYRVPAALVEANESALPSAAPPAVDNSAPGLPESNPEIPTYEAQEFDGTLSYIFSRAFRSESRSPSMERIFVSTDRGALTIIDENIVPETANRFDFFKDILLYRSRDVLADRLLRMGVDVSISSLGRFEDKIAFVIGATYPDESLNQLWVDKDTLLPLRLIIRGLGDSLISDSVEIRYLIWWKIGETQYPSKIEFYQDYNLVRVRQAQNFEENTTFSEELFDIEYLKTVYPRGIAQPLPAEAAEEPSEIQKTIQDFKRIFE